jgi:uncharacterized protein
MRESNYNVWNRDGETVHVFNGVSGEVIALTGAEADAAQSFCRGDEAAGVSIIEQLHKLVQARVIVNDDFDEVKFLAERYARGRHDTEHLGLTIVTSLGCNFDCPYCFEAKHPSLLSPQVSGAILEYVDARADNLKSLSVSWFGGEPLLGMASLKHLSNDFINLCAARDLSYTARITTNGYLLDEATCQELVNCHVSHVQVTLDGPADLHDRMRPLVSGRPTFATIVKNLHQAVEHFTVDIRVNVDSQSFLRTEELLQYLQDEGFPGRLNVYLAQLVDVADFAAAPSATYGVRCFNNKEFADAEQQFEEMADRHGFGRAKLPSPLGTPCTAVRANDLVIGSRGELYKCYESIGNPNEVIGHISDYKEPGGRAAKWLNYDPFTDPECTQCVALPVCMGGCAHHGLDVQQYSNRCDTFRHTYREQVQRFVTKSPGDKVFVPLQSIRLEKAR